MRNAHLYDFRKIVGKSRSPTHDNAKTVIIKKPKNSFNGWLSGRYISLLFYDSYIDFKIILKQSVCLVEWLGEDFSVFLVEESLCPLNGFSPIVVPDGFPIDHPNLEALDLFLLVTSDNLMNLFNYVPSYLFFIIITNFCKTCKYFLILCRLKKIRGNSPLISLDFSITYWGLCLR